MVRFLRRVALKAPSTRGLLQGRNVSPFRSQKSDLLASVGEEFRTSLQTARSETGGFRHREGDKRQVSQSVATGSQDLENGPNFLSHCRQKTWYLRVILGKRFLSKMSQKSWPLKATRRKIRHYIFSRPCPTSGQFQG